MTKHLSNPPITEALVDIKVKLPKSFNLELLKTIGLQISNDYPKEQELRISETQINFKDKEQTVSSENRINGYRFISSDGVRIVQLKEDGFTYNRLKPYSSWEDVRDEALRLWNLYSYNLKPEIINRVALRYINNLNIPKPIRDFGDYLTCPPEIPNELPQGILSYIYRVVVPNEQTKLIGIITQSLDHTVDQSETVPVMLDIDVFKVSTDGFRQEEIIPILEKLRNYKNEIFFSSITESLKEVYR